MSVTDDLAISYHQQDTDYYCGAACAQMVLDSIGAGLLDQDGLYTDNNSHSTIESNWYTAPDGLRWTLNHRRPAGASQYFVLYALANEEAISRKIVWTIHHYRVAPVALVYGWQHWIVVRGYDADAAPSAYDDTTYSISGFYLNNPWPPVPANPPGGAPPPHSGTDDCGTGGARGIADEHVSYATWQTDYMTGVPAGHWAGQFVAVCDPDPPPTRIGVVRAPPEGPVRRELLRPGDVAALAVKGLRGAGPRERPAWARSLAKAEPQTPMLVRRLDRPDDQYYIVPMRASGRVPGAVSIDAWTGHYRQAVAVRGGEHSLFTAASSDQLLASIADRVIELDEPFGRIRLRRDAWCLSPTLVWRPCRESFSPFYPFWMLTLGARTVYLRIDGHLFTSLHTSQRGI